MFRNGAKARKIGGIGSLFGQMSKSFGSPKHSGIKYANCLIKPAIS
jgi:hypothetical protein